MAQLFSDLVDASGRRYFFNLKSAPGGVAPTAPAALQIIGYAPTVLNIVVAFRTPEPARLTLNGLPLQGQPRIIPTPAQLTLQGQIPNELRQMIVTPALPPPDYAPPQGLAPTVLFINTVTPGVGLLTLQGLDVNASPGGNIGYVSPAPAQLTLQGLVPTTIFLEAGVGLLVLNGLQPSLELTLVVSPEPAALVIGGLTPALTRPFGWIDTTPPPPMTWTPTTGVNP